MIWTILQWLLAIGLAGFGLLILSFMMASMPRFNGAKAINKRLSNQYYYTKDGVAYCQNGNFFSLGKRTIENADRDSFEVLGYEHARDVNNVYFHGVAMPGVDSESFETIDVSETPVSRYLQSYYSRDKDSVYYLSSEITGADPKSFKVLWGGYSCDKQAIYCDEKKLQDCTDEPQRLVGKDTDDYLLAGNRVYYDNCLIQDADPATFEVLENNLSKDYRSVYLYGIRLDGVSSASFKLINEHYFTDSAHVYYFNSQVSCLKDSDPDTFTVVNNLFAKDKNHVYMLSQIVVNARPDEFSAKDAEMLDNDMSLFQVSLDEEHVEYISRDQMLEISDSFFSYHEQIFCGNVRVADADPDSFSVCEGWDGFYAKDKNKAYYRFDEIQGADLSSFHPLAENFAKDKKHVYYMEKRVVDAKPESFKYREDMYGEDIDEQTVKLICANSND